MKARPGRDRLLWHRKREFFFSIPLSIGLVGPGITYPGLLSLRSPQPQIPLLGSATPYPICSPLHVAAGSDEVQMAFPTWWTRADCCCSAHSLQVPGSPLCPALSDLPGSLLKTLLNCSALASKLSLSVMKKTIPRPQKAEENPACHAAHKRWARSLWGLEWFLSLLWTLRERREEGTGMEGCGLQVRTGMQPGWCKRCGAFQRRVRTVWPLHSTRRRWKSRASRRDKRTSRLQLCSRTGKAAEISQAHSRDSEPGSGNQEGFLEEEVCM